MLRKVLPWCCLLVMPACGSGGREPFATEAGTSVLVGSATEVAVESLGGGFAPPPPAGAACDPQKWRDDVVFTTGLLSWTKCHVTNTGADPSEYVPAPGSRTLTPSELADVRAAIDAVRVSSLASCGADKPQLTLTVFQGSDQLVYGDEFYACAKMYPAYVTSLSLDALVATLTQLTGL